MSNTLKVSELRIGNLVRNKREVQTNPNAYDVVNMMAYFKGYDSYVIHSGYFPPALIEMFEPIPLTEEWLVRFGFELWHEFGLKHYKLNNIDVVFGHYSGNYLTGSYEVKIQHVHQLQNLYFALTCEELTIDANKLQTPPAY